MFDFGNPEASARTLVESAADNSPGLVDKPIDEMTIEELKRSLVICRMASQMALEEGSGQSTFDIVLDWHDELLKALLAVDKTMRKHVLSHRFPYPRKKSQETIDYYRKLVEDAASES